MRIVSLCPSITESLVALGCGADLVGVTSYCIHPREALRGIARVGGTKNPDLAKIRALAPDLVFMNAEENRREDAEDLSRTLPVNVTHPATVSEVPDLLRRFGAATGREAEGEAWARRLEERLALSREPGRAPRPFTYAYLIWKDPWMTVNDGTYVADLLRFAGGRNVFGGRPVPYPSVTEAEVVEVAPDLLVLPDEPYRFRERDAAFWRERLAGEVHLVSGDDFCWHGVRTLRGLDAAEELAAAIAVAAG